MSGLDFCFMPGDDTVDELPADLIVNFLKRYYAVLPEKPQAWNDMIAKLEAQERVALLPL